jgi:predicted helicase
VCQPVSPSVEGERTSSRGGFEEVPPGKKKKKKAFLRLFFTFSNGVRSLRFDRRGLEKQMSVENVLELSNGAPLSRQFARAFAEPATTRARSPRVARVARPRAFVAFPAR